jgi:hypothetical protein
MNQFLAALYPWTQKQVSLSRHDTVSIGTERNIVRQLLCCQGWQSGPPAGLSTKELVEYQQRAAIAECACCGRVGLHFRPIHKKGFWKDVYEAYVHCTGCDHYERW